MPAVNLGLLWSLTDVIAASDVGLFAGPKRAAALQTAKEVVRRHPLTVGAEKPQGSRSSIRGPIALRLPYSLQVHVGTAAVGGG